MFTEDQKPQFYILNTKHPLFVLETSKQESEVSEGNEGSTHAFSEVVGGGQWDQGVHAARGRYRRPHHAPKQRKRRDISIWEKQS